MKPSRIALLPLLLLGLTIGRQPAAAPESTTSQKQYLADALDVVKTHALHRDRVDWVEVRRQAEAVAEHATTPAQTHDFLRDVLAQLGDQHSLLLPSAQMQQMQAPPDPRRDPRRQPVESRLLDGELGYVSVPGFMSTNAEASTAFVNELRGRIGALKTTPVCGWVVDLRGNFGGNMYPMLAGLAPLLGEGDAGRFVAPGKADVAWWIRNGNAGAGDHIAQLAVEQPGDTLADPVTVAVLTGPGTASSGEAIVVSFRAHPHARSFGMPTAGLSTGNTFFPLADGAALALTTVRMADRSGQVYGDRIWPDEVIPARMDAEDPTLDAAMGWLSGQPACVADPRSR